MNQFRYVRPGEQIKVSASAWNKIIDEVKFHPRSVGEDAGFQQSNFRVRMRNTSTGTLERWGVLEIAGMLESPSGATGPGLDTFQSWPGLVGAVPTSTAGAAFAVAVEPIKAGEIGMVAVDGVVQCKLDIEDPGHRYATTKTGSSSELKTASSGEAAILWKESGTGAGKWALVRMGAGSGGGSTIRLGQFSGPWYNEPGESGADNVKLVKLYVQPSQSAGANDWVPELDANGEEVIAVTLNLFSYIPTRSGNDSYMWCALLPISDQGGEYWSGGYDYIDGQDVPRMKPYSKLWLLLAAEC